MPCKSARCVISLLPFHFENGSFAVLSYQSYVSMHSVLGLDSFSLHERRRVS
jgi:hypothetical protein